MKLSFGFLSQKSLCSCRALCLICQQELPMEVIEKEDSVFGTIEHKMKKKTLKKKKMLMKAKLTCTLLLCWQISFSIYFDLLRKKLSTLLLFCFPSFVSSDSSPSSSAIPLTQQTNLSPFSFSSSVYQVKRLWWLKPEELPPLPVFPLLLPPLPITSQLFLQLLNRQLQMPPPPPPPALRPETSSPLLKSLQTPLLQSRSSLRQLHCWQTGRLMELQTID